MQTNTWNAFITKANNWISNLNKQMKTNLLRWDGVNSFKSLIILIGMHHLAIGFCFFFLRNSLSCLMDVCAAFAAKKNLFERSKSLHKWLVNVAKRQNPLESPCIWCDMYLSLTFYQLLFYWFCIVLLFCAIVGC